MPAAKPPEVDTGRKEGLTNKEKKSRSSCGAATEMELEIPPLQRRYPS